MYMKYFAFLLALIVSFTLIASSTSAALSRSVSGERKITPVISKEARQEIVKKQALRKKIADLKEKIIKLKKEIKAIKSRIEKRKIKNLPTTNEEFKLKNLMDSYNQAEQIMSDIQKKAEDTGSGIIQKIG